MPRKIEKIYSGDRVVKIRILPKVKKEIGKIEREAGEVKEKAIEIGKGVEKKAEDALLKITELKEKAGMNLDEAVTVFTKIPTITKEKAKMIYNEGFTSLKDLASAPAESLLKIRNITMENVKNIKKELKCFYEEEVKKIEIVRKEKPAVEKSMAWVEDVTKKMVSVGKDSLKKAKTGAFLAKDRVSKTYKKLATPEKPKPVEKKEQIKPKKKTAIKSVKKTKKVTKKKVKGKTKRSGRK